MYYHTHHILSRNRPKTASSPWAGTNGVLLVRGPEGASLEFVLDVNSFSWPRGQWGTVINNWLKQLNPDSKFSSRLTKIKFISGCYFNFRLAAVLPRFRKFSVLNVWKSCDSVKFSYNVTMIRFKTSTSLRFVSCMVKWFLKYMSSSKFRWYLIC